MTTDLVDPRRERPTTPQAARDLSVHPGRASAAAVGGRESAITESSLTYGYRNAGRGERVAIEPCACGEDIVAISRADADVYLAVASHNLLTVHQQWRARQFGHDEEVA